MNTIGVFYGYQPASTSQLALKLYNLGSDRPINEQSNTRWGYVVKAQQT